MFNLPKSRMIQGSQEELNVFAAAYEADIKYKIGEGGMDYLRNAQVWAYYNDKGQLLGGYAISTEERNPLRYFEFDPM